MPDVSTLKAFNRFILAFWMSDQGPVDVSASGFDLGIKC